MTSCPINPSQSKWYDNENNIWLFSTLELRRNLKTHPFPGKLSTDKKEKIGQMLLDACKSLPALKEAKKASFKDLTPLDKQVLYEYFMANQDFSSYRHAEHILMDIRQPFYVGIQLQDHLQFHWIDPQNNLEESWNTVLQIENQIAENFEFAFNPTFGFLTAHPNFCGIGLKASIFFHLPVLVHTQQLDLLLQKMDPHFFEIKGLGPDEEKGLGDLYLLRNKHSLSISEEGLFKSLRRVALDLSLEEEKARQNLNDSQKSSLKDRLGKAFGALKHASQLSLKEALDSLSVCKLAIDLGWLNGLSMQAINSLIFSIRKGSLGLLGASDQEIDFKRAEGIKQAFQTVTLVEG